MPRARAWVAEVLCAFDMSWLTGSAKLVAAELVTKAVKASWIHHHATVTVWLWADGRDLLIEVWDGSPEPPAPVAEPHGEGGRGLAIVAALSESWGITLTPAAVKSCGHTSSAIADFPLTLDRLPIVLRRAEKK